MTDGPLAGMRVLEAATYVSGPFAGQMLADLGAEVIKLEMPPDGDPFRTFGRPMTSVSAVFANCNRGKRSIAIDLKDSEARTRLLDLVEASDVWLCNWRPGVGGRLGLGDEILTSRNPRLIRAYITGYGESGVGRDEPVFDTIIQAASGLTDAIATEAGPSLLPGFAVDKMTAMMATQGILAALVSRARTGQGDRLDISMLAAASYVDFVELFANRTFGANAETGSRNPHATALRPVRTVDGWVAISPVSGRSIRAVCEVAGHPEWVGELRALEDQSRLAAELLDRLDTVLQMQPSSFWLEQFAANDVPVARCLTIDEHLTDARVEEQSIYRLVEWDGLGQVRTVRYPVEFGEFGRIGSAGPPPTVGRDTDLLENCR